jgi:hypothetical protein
VEYDAAAWSDEEVLLVDRALRTMHLRTGNTLLLKTASADNITLFRTGKSAHPNEFNASGWNYSDWPDKPEIVFTDEAFNDGANWTLQTVFHEFGHNWDQPHENSFIPEFRALSGWTQNIIIGGPFVTQYSRSGDGDWWYLADASFARDYGSDNPFEDWATTWAFYFMDLHGTPYNDDSSNISAPADKVAIVAEFVDSITDENHLA